MRDDNSQQQLEHEDRRHDMYVHVICCNDSVEFAVVDDEDKAKAKMTELSNAYFERNKWNLKDVAEYKQSCCWHIHTVSGA